jgi:hypothetical protein
MDDIKIKGYISQLQVSELIFEKYGFGKKNGCKRLIKEGVVTQTKVAGVKKVVFIKEEELNNIYRYLDDLRDNYYTAEDVWGLDEFKGVVVLKTIQALMDSLDSVIIHPFSRKKMVAKNEIDEFRENYYYKDSKLYHKTYLNDKEARELLEVHQNTLTSLLKKGTFPNYIDHPHQNFIPKEDIIAYQNKLRNGRNKTYDKKQALLDIQSHVNAVPVTNSCQETLKLYKEFSEITIQKINTQPKYLRAKVNHLNKFLNKLLEDYGNNPLFNKDIFLLDNEELEIVKKNMSEIQYIYMLFSSFLKYCYNKKGIKPSKTFSFTFEKERKGEKEIYSPKEFYDFYNYILEMDNHIEKSLVNDYHANMWVYSIVLMTDAWRASDIIYGMPHISIEDIGVTSFEWFSTNRLSNKQGQALINQLYIQLRRDVTGKTGAFLNFIVETNLVVPLAHALIISELHRRKYDNEFLLQTFVSKTSFKSVSTNGTKGHREFINESPLSKFLSRKLTRSVMTYLYHSVAEDLEGDADIALDINKHIRSHKRSNATEIYVQTTNKDGHIDQVSLQLFRRGQFGWLYNYLLMLAFQKEENKPTLEERTQQIESLRKEYPSPKDIESLGSFFYHKNNISPFKIYNGDMPRVIEDIVKKRSTLVSQLLNLPRAEIRNKLYKLAGNEMPSKNENAQCYVFPKCEYPNLRNCYTCEYVIPKHRLLIELKSEFNRVIDTIQSSKNENIIKKESMFLASIMLLVSEAIDAYGENGADFLSLEDIQQGCLQIANKINMDYFQGKIGG